MLDLDVTAEVQNVSTMKNRTKSEAHPSQPRLLWIDLRYDKRRASLRTEIDVDCDVCLHVPGSDLHAPVPAVNVICCEYDYPDPGGLKSLLEIKRLLPTTPIMVLTEQHSEDLAVWALRAHVWDYIVQPVTAPHFLERIAAAFPPPAGGISQPGTADTLPAPLATELRLGYDFKRNRVARAVHHIHRHYPAKITLRTVADLCEMGPFQFSRAFKQHLGITFREFLLRHRIARAAGFLKNPRASVTDVAFAVGFTDLSYFARMFRRYTGSAPSQYRTACHAPEPAPAEDEPASLQNTSEVRATDS
jgi:AraC-like DNA-binding protein